MSSGRDSRSELEARRHDPNRTRWLSRFRLLRGSSVVVDYPCPDRMDCIGFAPSLAAGKGSREGRRDGGTVGLGQWRQVPAGPARSTFHCSAWRNGREYPPRDLAPYHVPKAIGLVGLKRSWNASSPNPCSHAVPSGRDASKPWPSPATSRLVDPGLYPPVSAAR